MTVGKLLKALEGRHEDEAVYMISYGKTIYSFRVKPKPLPVCAFCRDDNYHHRVQKTPWGKSNICLECLELKKEELMKNAPEKHWCDVMDRIGGSYKQPFLLIKQYGKNIRDLSWKKIRCPNCRHIFELLTSTRYEVRCVKCNYQSDIMNEVRPLEYKGKECGN